jgi:hypothetical protein
LDFPADFSIARAHGGVIVGRIKQKEPIVPTAADAKPAKKKAAGCATEAALPAVRHPLARRRALAIAVLLVVAVLAMAGRELWRRAAPYVIGRERYLLPGDRITISPPPEWIVSDVRGQVVHHAGLDRRLSMLDPNFAGTIQNAFALHPWVASVDRVEKAFPPAVHVVLTYRRPVAAIEAPQGEGFQLLPVDEQGVRLPAEDVPAIRLRYLPRLTGVVGPPPAGQTWDDPRVVGGVDLAARLAGDWESLHLFEIVPSARPEIQGDRRYFVYDLRSGGGTQIIWGAPPQEIVPGEDAFDVKLQRLKQCAAQYGPLDSVKSPAVIDIRRGIAVTPRTVKKLEAADGETVVK